ncbi:MAG TPA: hypothetical protein VIP09_04605 [Dehalococcoidia bacterium]
MTQATTLFNSESNAGYSISLAMMTVGGTAIYLLWRAGESRDEAQKNAQRNLTAVVAFFVTYTIYVAAALMTEAPALSFFQNHFFDGAAPAAVVAFLIAFAKPFAKRTYPETRDQVLTFVLVVVSGGLLFGAIGTVAAFTANGPRGIPLAAGYCALAGAGMGAYAVVLARDRSL